MDYSPYLVHQVHLAKLTTDVVAGTASTWLLWCRRILVALLAAFVPAAAASAALLRRDLSNLAETRRGRYVLVHMPPSAQAVRMVGQAMAWHAAYRHRPVGMAAGFVVVGVGWSHGLLALARSARAGRQA